MLQMFSAWPLDLYFTFQCSGYLQSLAICKFRHHCAYQHLFHTVSIAYDRGALDAGTNWSRKVTWVCQEKKSECRRGHIEHEVSCIGLDCFVYFLTKIMFFCLYSQRFHLYEIYPDTFTILLHKQQNNASKLKTKDYLNIHAYMFVSWIYLVISKLFVDHSYIYIQ